MTAPRPAMVREEVVLANMALQFVQGGVLPNVDRFIRAWAIVAGAYKREHDFAGAKRCDDMAVTLSYWQRRRRAGDLAAAVLP